MKLKALSLFVLSLFVVEASFADYRPRPPRPAPHRPRPVPAPHRPRPVPAPIPRPRPIPQRPRPVPVPIPRPIPRPVPAPSFSACFYELPHYQGNYFCVNRGDVIPNLSYINFNNRISSAIIPAGFYARVYDYEGFSGQSLELTGGVPDLGMYGWDWNNNISSIEYRY